MPYSLNYFLPSAVIVCTLGNDEANSKALCFKCDFIDHRIEF